jgi:hypothetical protein
MVTGVLNTTSSVEYNTGGISRTGYIIGNTFGYIPVNYYDINGIAMFEGDIILGTVQEMEALAEEIRRGIPRSVAITVEQNRWQEGIIPFTIAADLPNVRRVNTAIQHWNQNTNIRLIPRTTERNFVTFRPAAECSSELGMRGREQFINLAAACVTGNVIHEIGHTVGLWHEQSREDRDRFVRILYGNIQAGQQHNFDQHITDGDDIGPYDFGSIMHYSATTFSVDGTAITIQTLGGETIGQRIALSAGDRDAVNFIYPRIGRLVNLLMAWKGAGDDQGIYYSTYDGANWSAQQFMRDGGTSIGPTLTVFNAKLFMAWKGAGDDQGIYYSTYGLIDWSAQQNIPGVGTSVGPIIASVTS